MRRNHNKVGRVAAHHSRLLFSEQEADYINLIIGIVGDFWVFRRRVKFYKRWYRKFIAIDDARYLNQSEWYKSEEQNQFIRKWKTSLKVDRSGSVHLYLKLRGSTDKPTRIDSVIFIK